MKLEDNLGLLNRDGVVAVIDDGKVDTSVTEGRFSCLYQGKRYDPKHLVHAALVATVGNAPALSTWEGVPYEEFNDALVKLSFSVVKNPKNPGDTTLPVLLYEVKRPDAVQANYHRLFSADEKRFYWNRDKFSELKAGDPVFILNVAAGKVHFGFLEDKSIPANFDIEKNVSAFSHKGEAYEVAGQWDAFVSVRLRDTRTIPSTWKWKTLGSGEHTYLAGPKVSEGAAANNVERVNLLLELFPEESEAALQLHTCYYTLSEVLPKSSSDDAESEPKVWYVFQGNTFNAQEAAPLLWAPLSGQDGRHVSHWDAMKDLRVGDIIVEHAGGVQALSQVITPPEKTKKPYEDDVSWKDEGWLVHLKRLLLVKPIIEPSEARSKHQSLSRALSELRGPYDYSGSGKFGYLFEFNWEALAILLSLRQLVLPREIAKWLPEPPQESEVPPAEEEDAASPEITAITETSSVDWLPKVHQYILAQGFQYTLADVANLYLSLKTKPFCILAGISGTGKTQLIRQFAKAIGYGDASHSVLIPVRPDWADSSDLIGYPNIQGKFVSQPLLEVMQRAISNPNELFFVVLDEMNLARVEHYFAEFLSLIETRERKADQPQRIVTHAWVNRADVNGGRPVYLPQNLMVVGTVNMDETTHPFSRKVLDRANAIEMNEIDLDWQAASGEEATALTDIYADALSAPYLNAKDLSQEDKEALGDEIALMKDINAQLEPAGLHFGYRVRDEMAFYLTLCRREQLDTLEGFSLEDALDFQLMQKVLPRVQGSSSAVLRALLGLIQLLTGAKVTDDSEYEEVCQAVEVLAEIRYPRSTRKLLFMLQRFSDDGFTSYWL